MTISSLAVTGSSDLPETHLFIGLARAGVDIEVMCPPQAPHRQLLLDAGVKTHDLNLKNRFDKAGVAAIHERLTARKTDIIHAFNNKAVSNSLRASRGMDLSFIAYRGIEGNVSYWDPASWTTYLHPRVDVIVCVADAIRRYFHNMRFLGIRAPVRKARTIYKGHNPDWYNAEPIDLGTLGVPDGSFVVGCTVNDRPRKGLQYLTQATYELPADADIHWVLVGEIGNPKLNQLIEESPARDRIHLTGFRRDAAAIISACDVCILPAIKREGLPKGIIEGMIQGVAPIVTSTGGSPELIEPGVSGLIIPPSSSTAIAEAVLRLYRDHELTQRMQQQARKRIAEHFRIEDTIDTHLALYQELAKK